MVCMCLTRAVRSGTDSPSQAVRAPPYPTRSCGTSGCAPPSTGRQSRVSPWSGPGACPGCRPPTAGATPPGSGEPASSSSGSPLPPPRGHKTASTLPVGCVLSLRRTRDLPIIECIGRAGWGYGELRANPGRPLPPACIACASLFLHTLIVYAAIALLGPASAPERAAARAARRGPARLRRASSIRAGAAAAHVRDVVPLFLQCPVCYAEQLGCGRHRGL